MVEVADQCADHLAGILEPAHRLGGEPDAEGHQRHVGVDEPVELALEVLRGPQDRIEEGAFGRGWHLVPATQVVDEGPVGLRQLGLDRLQRPALGHTPGHHDVGRGWCILT